MCDFGANLCGFVDFAHKFCVRFATFLSEYLGGFCEKNREF